MSKNLTDSIIIDYDDWGGEWVARYSQNRRSIYGAGATEEEAVERLLSSLKLEVRLLQLQIDAIETRKEKNHDD